MPAAQISWLHHNGDQSYWLRHPWLQILFSSTNEVRERPVVSLGQYGKALLRCETQYTEWREDEYFQFLELHRFLHAHSRMNPPVCCRVQSNTVSPAPPVGHQRSDLLQVEFCHNSDIHPHLSLPQPRKLTQLIDFFCNLRWSDNLAKEHANCNVPNHHVEVTFVRDTGIHHIVFFVADYHRRKSVSLELSVPIVGVHTGENFIHNLVDNCGFNALLSTIDDPKISVSGVDIWNVLIINNEFLLHIELLVLTLHLPVLGFKLRTYIAAAKGRLETSHGCKIAIFD